MTKTRILALLMVLALMSGLVAACAKPAPAPAPPKPAPAPAPAPPKVFEWKLQSAFGVGSWDNLSIGERVTKRLETVTEGRIKIKYLAPGTIVAPFEQLDAVEKGVLDVSSAWSGYWVGKNSAFTLFASVAGGPFGLDNWDHTGWMFFGGGYDLWREVLAVTGYKNIVPFIVKGEFTEPMGWFPKPIKKIEDLAGYKMRVAGMAAEVFKEAGVSVVTIPGGEILPALEKKLIDATEYSDPHSDLLLGIPDILKYYHAPGVHQPTGYGEWLINRARWEELPSDLKYMVELTCHESVLKNNLEEFVVGYPAFVEILTKKGVTFVPAPPDVLKKLLEAWDKVAARESAKNPQFAKIYESQRKYAEWLVPYKRKFIQDYSFTADYYWK